MEEPRSFQERLSRKFRPTDFVRVVNIDDEPYEWDYCADEEVMQTPTSRIIAKRQIDHYVLEAGQSTKLPGAVAYVMMDGLFKKVCTKETEKPQMVNLPEVQEEYIERIFVDIENDYLKPKERIAAKLGTNIDEKPAPAPVAKDGTFDPAEIGLGGNETGVGTLEGDPIEAFPGLSDES